MFVLPTVMYRPTLFCLLLALTCTSPALPQDISSVQKVYLIGNSLTWDTLPGLLKGDVQWHVDCGKNLKYIFEHPTEPCVKTSKPWPQALQEKQYDVLSVQPHFGTNLDEDAEIIAHWLDMQPSANLVIHTGWNRLADFESHYHAPVDHQRMVHSPRYFEMLVERLSQRFPNRKISTTRAIDVLDVVWHDIENAQAPFKAFSELYRDDIHMTTQVGRYLMHNVMRMALGQPVSHQGFEIESEQRAYIDNLLHHRWQEPQAAQDVPEDAPQP